MMNKFFYLIFTRICFIFILIVEIKVDNPLLF